MLKESYPTLEEGLRTYIQAYLACVAFVDEQVGTVVYSKYMSRAASVTTFMVIELFVGRPSNSGPMKSTCEYRL